VAERVDASSAILPDALSAGRDMAQQTSNHIVVDASGFADKFAEFEKDCTSPE